MAKDSCLLLWYSGYTLPMIFWLLNVWGYTYKGVLLVWFKANSRPDLGYYTRSNVEFIVFAMRG